LIDSDMNPVLIDPSVSYSHPEQDLAMLELFGSPLSSSDLDLLARETGLPAGRIERRDFFQLYPLLVHVNLFGASYVSQARRAIGRYL
ncbi:MAG TPA: fructosamine kinase family protein, partial [Leptospiraceae bacterium]|nr:fructosamine kinase family protein [Leptospiraceae bacterium]